MNFMANELRGADLFVEKNTEDKYQWLLASVRLMMLAMVADPSACRDVQCVDFCVRNSHTILNNKDSRLQQIIEDFRALRLQQAQQDGTVEREKEKAKEESKKRQEQEEQMNRMEKTWGLNHCRCAMGRSSPGGPCRPKPGGGMGAPARRARLDLSEFAAKVFPARGGILHNPHS